MYDLEQEAGRVRRALEGLLVEIAEARREMEQAQARLEGLIPLRVVWKGKTCGKRGLPLRSGAAPRPLRLLGRTSRRQEARALPGQGLEPAGGNGLPRALPGAHAGVHRAEGAARAAGGAAGSGGGGVERVVNILPPS